MSTIGENSNGHSSRTVRQSANSDSLIELSSESDSESGYNTDEEDARRVDDGSTICNVTSRNIVDTRLRSGLFCSADVCCSFLATEYQHFGSL